MGVGAGHYWGGRRREEATRGEESRRGWWVAGYRLPASAVAQGCDGQGQTYGYFNRNSNKSQQKNDQNFGGFWMQLLKCAGCAGVATGSILVYAYILMYYIKDRGFRGGGYLKEGFGSQGFFS